jgi:glycolate oxidase iron-sulfur subunit
MTESRTAGVAVAAGRLGVDPDDLAACVACGLCLAHCPTYRVTGEEGLSPRGRIAAMRAVDEGAPADDTFASMMQTCVQCRACETACPSSVPFGRLMEGARELLAPIRVPAWQKAAYRLLDHHRALLVLTGLGAVAQRAGLIPARLGDRLGLPRLPWRPRPLVATGDDVWLFTGCVMDAWQRDVHHAAIAVAGACGAGVALPGAEASCCGALHVHAGLRADARRLARRVMRAFPGEAPILVDSAGCGAALKDYGHLLGTEAARKFSGRVLDIHEWLAQCVDRLPPAVTTEGRIAVQDPCHLRHVQRCEAAVRTVLAPYGELVDVPDEGRCCGAGGAYGALQPVLARQIRTQKLAAIASTGADLVASANPGCAMWLAAAGLPVAHPVEIIARAAGLEVADGR